MNKDTGHLIVIYDNYTLKSAFRSAWGFSGLVRLPGYRILFDTGGDPSTLLHNMREMDIHPEEVDNVILSHAHGDHVGGIALFLGHRKVPVTVYLPESFPKNFKEDVARTGARVQEIGTSSKIHRGVHTTGQLGGGIKEQSLVLTTSRGLIVVTGCAHPGIVEIVEHARSLFEDPVYLLIGGFHLMGKSPEGIKRIARQLDDRKVKWIAPCHCSGDNARKLFRQYYGDHYIKCGVGLTLEIPDVKE